ncbi:hypothetical protein KKB99_00475 [bacterium]|nr:hypothetical protein [bacterium]MBU1024460.1 hypothetical protein [bacterium]
MKNGQTSNVFYTFGFLLLYIHLLMNIVYLNVKKEFFDSPAMNYSIIPFGNASLTIKISIFELILVGGFILFTIVGLITERIRLIGQNKEAAVGWKYRNRLKLWYSIIAIILVLWTTIQGFITIKEFDWVWLSGSAMIVIFSIFLAMFPRQKVFKRK